MRLILSLTLLWAFSSTAGAIRCHVCTDFNDLDCAFGETVSCADGEMCLNAFITEKNEIQRKYRDCASPSVCPATGPLTIAANVGDLHILANAECCNSDECNLLDVALGFPAAPVENNIQCTGCDPDEDECNLVVNCKGEEDTCFRSEILKDRVRINVGGCGTSNVCDVANDIRFLPFLEEVGTVLFTPTCFPFTTTPEPTTTLEPTTTVPETTTPEATATTDESASTPIAPPTVPGDSTTKRVNKLPGIVLRKIRFLLQRIRLLAGRINMALLQQQQVVLFQLHVKILGDQSRLLAQQEELPIDHHQQLPLHYQQCLLVNNHQMLLHQIHLSLCGEQKLLLLFQEEQKALHELQNLFQTYYYHLLPHYAGHLQYHCDHGHDHFDHGGHGGGHGGD